MPSIVAHRASALSISDHLTEYRWFSLHGTSISDSRFSIAFCNASFVLPFSMLFNLECIMPIALITDPFNSSRSTYCPLPAFMRGENSAAAPIF